MEKVILLLVSILPVILIGTYIYKKDQSKEPVKILIKLFLGGALSVVIVILATIILEIFFPGLVSDNITSSNFITLFFKVLFGVGIIEEGSKWIIAYSFSYNSKHYEEYYDIVLYSAFVALGFACVENIMYVFKQGLTIGILRLFTTVPAHSFMGVIMGEYLGLAKISEGNNNLRLKRKNLWLSVLLPTMLHTFYDYFAFLRNEYAIVLLVATVIFGYITSIDKIKRISKLRYHRYHSNFCTNCGTKIEGNFCSCCGMRRQ